MTQEDKKLLLKDICARIPYGVKLYCIQCTPRDRKKGWTLVGYREANIEEKDIFGVLVRTRHRIILNCVGPNNNVDIDFINDEVKPYLFPLSSMTKEQEEELAKLGVSYGEYALHDDTRGLGIMVDEAYIFFEFCYKHHIDFLGLIKMGLAIDATNLNIY